MKSILFLLLWLNLCDLTLSRDITRLPPNVQRFIYNERYLLDRSRDPESIYPDTEQLDPRYSPEGGQIFNVKGFWIEERFLDSFAASSDNYTRKFIKSVGGKTYYLFLIHPQSETFYTEFLQRSGKTLSKPDRLFWAAPTASSRALIAWEENKESSPFYVKLSLAIRIGNADRTIKAEEIARSVGHTMVLNLMNQNQKKLDYFEEPLGIAPKGMARGGMLVREMPADMLSGDVEYIPLFSLYSEPKDATPILVDMIRRSGLSPQEFITQKIMAPFAKQWIDLAIDEGVFSEVHAQNVLVKVDRNRSIMGFVHRDMGGFNIDLKYRIRSAQPMPMDLPKYQSYARTYLQSMHRSEPSIVLEYYFLGGFVYNLENKIPAWQASGKIGGLPMRKGDVESLFLKALRTYYYQKTGLVLHASRGNYSEISNAVYAARRRLHPRPHMPCNMLYGEHRYIDF